MEINTEPLDGVCASDLKAAQAEIAKGRWKKSGQAADWVGIPIAVALKLDRSNKGDREKIKSLIAIWIKSGMLKVVIGKDGTRHDASSSRSARLPKAGSTAQ